MPYSVTTYRTSPRFSVIPAASWREGTMREMVSFLAVDLIARMVRPPFDKQRAAHEIVVSADAAVERAADRVRGGLAGEVDFQRAVDGHHVVLLGDLERVVRDNRSSERGWRGCR